MAQIIIIDKRFKKSSNRINKNEINNLKIKCTYIENSKIFLIQERKNEQQRPQEQTKSFRNVENEPRNKWSRSLQSYKDEYCRILIIEVKYYYKKENIARMQCKNTNGVEWFNRLFLLFKVQVCM